MYMGTRTTRGSRGKADGVPENHLRPNSFTANKHLRELRIEVMPIVALKPHERNPRTHSAEQIRQIAESIRRFGFTNPVLIDNAGGVIAGHGRLSAASLLGIERVPTIQLADMSEAQKRAYLLADNRLAENAGWDRELLRLELQYISQLDLDFDSRLSASRWPRLICYSMTAALPAPPTSPPRSMSRSHR